MPHVTWLNTPYPTIGIYWTASARKSMARNIQISLCCSAAVSQRCSGSPIKIGRVFAES